MPQAYRVVLFAVALALPLLGLAQEKEQAKQPSDGPDAERTAPPAAKNCDDRSLLLNFPVYRDGEPIREVPIWRLGDSTRYFFAAGMTIDADGAPNAYNPGNTGLDDLSNAGQPGHWDGVLQDANGDPLVQGPDDPFPGYYISCTSLADRTKKPLDPTRFVDASRIPYVVLPREVAFESGTRLGDFAVVMNLRSGAWSYAIFADIGTFGEGSVALANNLGIWSDARRGGRRGGVLYLVFPGSGNGQPRSIDEIDELAGKAFQDWGGAERLNSCAASEMPTEWYR
jgi:Fungal chitosanase of glycosyl hydrolase group 75